MVRGATTHGARARRRNPACGPANLIPNCCVLLIRACEKLVWCNLSIWILRHHWRVSRCFPVAFRTTGAWVRGRPCTCAWRRPVRTQPPPTALRLEHPQCREEGPSLHASTVATVPSPFQECPQAERMLKRLSSVFFAGANFFFGGESPSPRKSSAPAIAPVTR